MKHFCAILVMLFCCQIVSAIDIMKASQCDYITIPYISVDAENKPVVLSAFICYPTKSAKDKTPKKAKFLVLGNHGTITDDSQSPTGDDPLDAITYMGIAPHGALCLMTTEDAIVISCDYLGYGYSKDRVHPYCNHTLTARNVVDGFIASLDTIKARGIQLADDYYTYNVGYSQGGAVTMAVQKYLETEASQEVVDIFRLKKSICGAGPYNLEYIFEDLCTQDALSYSCSLPLTLESLYAAYYEGCLKQVDLDSVYITPEFHQEMVKIFAEKDKPTDEICEWINSYFGKSSVSVRDMFKYDELVGEGPIHKAIVKSLKKCNMLDGSWMPQTPMILFQYTGDEVVPYGNSMQAAELFGDKVKLYTEQDNLKCSNALLRSMVSILMSNPKTHSDYGTLFYAYFLDGVLRGGIRKGMHSCQ